MSLLSQFRPHLGAPTRTTRYTSGSGAHTFAPGAAWCRLTLVGGGGNGGNTGTWNDGGGNYFYEAGGGGGGGETRVIECDPQRLASAAYAVGAAASDTAFGPLRAERGMDGSAGSYEGGGALIFEGGRGGGVQLLGANGVNEERPLAPRNGMSAPGTSGGGKAGPGGTGGASLLGAGGAGGAYVSAAYPAPCNNGAGGSGFGGGGGGGGGATDTSGATRTLGTGGAGAGGLIVIEEWVY